MAQAEAKAETMTQREQIEQAARELDWRQVALNGGPPCFHIEDRRFCLRAQRWAQRWEGHGVLHSFVTLEEVIKKATAELQAENERLRTATLEQRVAQYSAHLWCDCGVCRSY